MSVYLNNDRILQAVLKDCDLCKKGGFSPDEYRTITEAMNSDNTIVKAVAKIIEAYDSETSERTMYTSINNFLKDNL